MHELLQITGRTIYQVPAPADCPAVYYIHDHEVGGILVNTPPYSEQAAAALAAAGGVSFIFLPSRFGAHDLAAWREATGAETMAYEIEAGAIAGGVDIALNSKTKLTRTIDFLPMAGRTEGSCALRLKNKPGVVFFGPILSPGEHGWPTLAPNEDDHSYESRLFGALGLQDVKFEYAFTDEFDPQATRFGPGADRAIREEIDQALGV